MARHGDHDHGTADARANPGAIQAPASPRPHTIDALSRDRIGRELRDHYARVLALPIPDHLRVLLDELAARAERESS